MISNESLVPSPSRHRKTGVGRHFKAFVNGNRRSSKASPQYNSYGSLSQQYLERAAGALNSRT